MRRFAHGERIELAEMWNGRVWELRQAIVVRDTEEAIVLYTPPYSVMMVAVDGSGSRLRLPEERWEMKEDSSWGLPALAVHAPGTGHSVILIWEPDWRLSCWYVNLESDLERTGRRFQYEERVLDIVVEPDMSSWRWKDEEELEEAVSRGLFTREQAREFREEGERAVRRLLSRERPYDERWEDWRPPEGWADRHDRAGR
jgi:predicted RNA-binding protein associated with RNAse of E/G family